MYKIIEEAEGYAKEEFIGHRCLQRVVISAFTLVDDVLIAKSVVNCSQRNWFIYAADSSLLDKRKRSMVQSAKTKYVVKTLGLMMLDKISNDAIRHT